HRARARGTRRGARRRRRAADWYACGRRRGAVRRYWPKVQSETRALPLPGRRAVARAAGVWLGYTVTACAMNSPEPGRKQLRRWAFAMLFSLAAAVLWPAAGAAQDEPAREALRAAVERVRYNGNAAAAGIHAPNLVAAFYERREFRPAWREPERVDALLRLVDGTFADGLEPRDYHREQIVERRRELDGGGTTAERADFELLLTDALMSLVHHRRLGKTNPQDQHNSWNARAPRAEVDTLELVEQA